MASNRHAVYKAWIVTSNLLLIIISLDQGSTSFEHVVGCIPDTPEKIPG